MFYIVTPKTKIALEGGDGSGHYGHAGILGHVGGSSKLETGLGDVGFEFGDSLSDKEQDFIHGDMDSESTTLIPFKSDNLGDKVITTALQEKIKSRSATLSDKVVPIKMAICEKLSDDTGIPYDTVKLLVHQWARSSNDTAYPSLFFQKCVSEEFGVPLTEFQAQSLAPFEKAYADFLAVPGMTKELLDKAYTNAGTGYSDGVSWLLEKNGISAEVSRNIQNYLENTENALITNEVNTKKFLRAMYDETQRVFKNAGVDRVLLARGYFPAAGEKGEAGIHRWEGNSMESWSSNTYVANRFGNLYTGGEIIYASIPSTRIIGSCVSGFGCLEEHEFVVLSGINDVIYRRTEKTKY